MHCLRVVLGVEETLRCKLARRLAIQRGCPVRGDSAGSRRPSIPVDVCVNPDGVCLVVRRVRQRDRYDVV